jgi:DNA-binding PadR family transcriptional regulator
MTVQAQDDADHHRHPDVGRWEKLPQTTWAVLGLLSFGRPLTGYQLKKWADAILAFFYWSPAVSQIYSELRRLESLGLASSELVAGKETHQKRVYAITPAGRDALEWWQAEVDVEPPMLKHTVALRVWLGHMANPTRLTDLLREHATRCSALATAADSAAEVSESEPDFRFPAIVAEWAASYYRSEVLHAENLLNQVESLSAAERGPDGSTGETESATGGDTA